MLNVESHQHCGEGQQPAALATPDRQGQTVLQPDHGPPRHHVSGTHRRWQDHCQNHPAEGAHSDAHHCATGRERECQPQTEPVPSKSGDIPVW